MRASMTPRHASSRASMASQQLGLLSPTSMASFPYGATGTPARSAAMRSTGLFSPLAGQRSGDFSDLNSSFNDAAAAASSSSSNSVARMEESILVHVRLRPTVEGHQSEAARNGDCVSTDASGKSVTLSAAVTRSSETKRMQFDHVFPQTATQEELAAEVNPRFVRACLQGYNGTIFAYGQTGSGKTFTMTGSLEPDSPQRGLIPRLLKSLFSDMEKRESDLSQERVTFSVVAEFVEIYNENLRDLLLSPLEKPMPLDIRTLPTLHVNNLTRHELKSYDDAMRKLDTGNKARTFGITKMNDNSSRSHSVFTLYITTKYSDNRATTSKLNLVDLAGSENQKSAGTSGDRLKEGANINKSLSILSQVISALSQKRGHIPFRNSKLTFLLSDSIGGNSKTTLIATVSPLTDHAPDTLNTLNFANTAKTIKLDIQQNLQVNGQKVDPVALQKKLDTAIAENAQLRIAQKAHDDIVQQLHKNGERDTDAAHDMLDIARGSIEQLTLFAAEAGRIHQQSLEYTSDIESMLQERDGELDKAREEIEELKTTVSLSKEEAGNKVMELHGELREEKAAHEHTQSALDQALAKIARLEEEAAAAESARIGAEQFHAAKLQALAEEKRIAADSAVRSVEAVTTKLEAADATNAQLSRDLAAERESVSQWTAAFDQLSEETNSLLSERAVWSQKESEWQSLLAQSTERQRAHLSSLGHTLKGHKLQSLAAVDPSLPLSIDMDRDDSLPLPSASPMDYSWASQNDALFRDMIRDLCAPIEEEGISSPRAHAKPRHSSSSRLSSPAAVVPLSDRAQLPAASSLRSPLGSFLEASKRRESRSAQRQSLSPMGASWAAVIEPVEQQLERDAPTAKHSGGNRRSLQASPQQRLSQVTPSREFR